MFHLMNFDNSGHYYVEMAVGNEEGSKKNFMLMVDTGISDILIYSNECQQRPRWLSALSYCPSFDKLRSGQVTLNYKSHITMQGRVSMDSISTAEVNQISLFRFLFLY